VRGKPAACISDNGTELTSMAILRWSQESAVEWHYVRPESRSRAADSRTPSSKASTAVCVTSC
jgi:hypothetical protein